jgi:sulfatase modifying factor 1
MRYLAALCVAILVFPAITHAEDLPSGISKEKPAEGPSVKIDAGYMVPYTVELPNSKVTFKMIPVPGGKFKMGSPDAEAGRKETEGPQFEVVVKPFWIAEHEVTWGEYKEFMKLHDAFKLFETKKLRKVSADRLADAITAPSNLYDSSFTFTNGEEPELPAVTMSQFAAKQYTKWISLLGKDFYRLPTEAEWEYACRGGANTAFHFGDDAKDLDDYGWHYDNSDYTTHPVMEKKPNSFGLYDMHGNVSEWVLDAPLKDGYAKFKGKTVSSDEALVWPTELFPRILKGGNFDLDPEDLRVAARLHSHDDDWRSEDPNFPQSPWWFTGGLGVGFRIMRPLDAPEAAADREKYWKPDIEQIRKDADFRIDEEGRGARGLVDPSLPEAIKQLDKKKD